ncbi:NAD(P)-binding protein [Acidimicrobium ferrooxidans]|uniref:NAD(P)-binding protein n=1 Tax=Acidimicrobium ferrooxidans TaxID=53635 RepID=A0ABS3AS35_9ACTN|nr:NAD(P)-binding protein [Acidimicrobium ferrooxidans]
MAELDEADDSRLVGQRRDTLRLVTGAETLDVVVVGAGIAGIAAACELAEADLRVRVIERANSVGGRMTSARLGEARFDHGAQFFTTRSRAFKSLIEMAESAGVVKEWSKGFDAEPDGFSRWCGVDGMADLVDFMASGLDVQLGVSASDLRAHPARAYILTAPVPQTMAILMESNLLPSPSLTTRLTTEITYRPTIAVLATYTGSTAMASHGGSQTPDHEAISFVGDNFLKGVSAERSLTLHLSEPWSNNLWDASDQEIIDQSWAAFADRAGSAELVTAAVYRWRYAGPSRMWPTATEIWGDTPVVALAGEAFDGPKVEGAFLSGRAAARAVIERLVP